MKYLWLFCIPLLGMTQIGNEYSKEPSVSNEFKNIYDNGQDQSFEQKNSTPAWQDMKNGQIFIYISSPPAQDVTLMLRVGSTVYVSPNFTIMKGR